LEGCGVCASNIPVWEGKPWFDYPMEAGSPGHEGWGRIEKIGENVTDFSVGERVGLLSCHAYAEYDICDQGAAVKLPVALNAQSFPAEPLGCAMNIFARCAINRDGVVAIVGIGFLGALLTQLAQAVGARVIAISRSEFALNVAREMGAWRTLVLGEPSPVVAQVKNLTNDQFCDVVIECTGKQRPLNLAAELTRERGRLVIGGYHQDGPRQVNLQLWNWRGLDVINAHERDPGIYRNGMTGAVRAVEAGLLDATPLFTHTFPLERLADALDTAAARPTGFMKALVLMQ
jgi:threonine dehydrogenase-like Zn-dependent dehydrogenase